MLWIIILLIIIACAIADKAQKQQKMNEFRRDWNARNSYRKK